MRSHAMVLHSWKLLLLLIACLQPVQSNLPLAASKATARLAFAGGGFGGSSASSKKAKKKRKRGGIRDGVDEPPTTVTKKVNDEPKLDKWGLPPPTEDDIFPPLPPETELIPASDAGGTTSLKEIMAAMKGHMPLAYDEFDENGVERSPTPGNEPMQLRLLFKSPPVLVIENFFTVQECEETQAVTNANAYQVSSATFSPLATSKRTSTSWFCHYKDMATLVAKAHARLGIPIQQMEEPQIVRYKTGEEFSWHEDQVPPAQLENGGQRIATLLVYLNTVQRGGGTVFKYLKDAHGEELAVKPVQGSALLFFPAFANGRPDERTLHKGQVAEDVKWITQMWIHERAYQPVVPVGNTHEAAQEALEQVNKKLGYQY